MNETQNAPSKFPLRQVSLRTLLLITLLLSVWLAVEFRRYQSERYAAAQIEAQLQRVEIGWTDPSWWPFGRSMFSRVTSISIEDDELTDEELLAVEWERFSYLSSVSLVCPLVSDSGSTKLSARMAKVEIESVVFDEPIVDQPAAPSVRPSDGR